MDVKAAFDKVWHKGMIAKLNQINIKGKVLELFTSYLTNRQQIVVIDGGKSKKREIKAGIPQGSKLGPILSFIYINDITSNIEIDILILLMTFPFLPLGMTQQKLLRYLTEICKRYHNGQQNGKLHLMLLKQKI